MTVNLVFKSFFILYELSILITELKESIGIKFEGMEHTKAKELKEKIINREMLTIKPLDENLVYAYLCSFKDLDYSLNNAKQRLIDMFVNRVVLFDDHCDIYFNISDDKGTQLKLSEQPDFEQETEFLAKKEQPEQKCSDCYHLAES